MSDKLEDLVNGLTQETMVDMAGRFFGARKAVDEDVELFGQLAKVVFQMGEEAVSQAGLLMHLLQSEENAHEFFVSLGVAPGRMLTWVPPVPHAPQFPIARALTARGRWTRLFMDTYHSVQQSFDEYLHGRYYTDPRHPAQKRLSIHYGLLKQWCGDINGKIRQVNDCQAPSCVLGLSKSLIGDADRERLVGGPIDNFACSLDAELRLPFVDCSAHNLKELPELPPLHTVEPKVKSFAHTLYAHNPDQCQQMFAHIKSLAA